MTAVFLSLLFLARKEEVAPGTASLLRPFYKIALYLIKKICLRFPKMFSSAQVEKDLNQLHPGEPGEFLKTEYYAKKMALCIAIALLGTVFGAAVRLSAQDQVILRDEGTVGRGSYKEGIREIRILADYGGQQMDFQMQVEPKHLTAEETEAMFDDFLDRLPEYILGKNESMQEIRFDLVLEDTYEGFPVTVEWKSSRQDILSNSGRVRSVEKVERVNLSVFLDYHGQRRASEIALTLVPPVLSEEEQLYREMEEMLQQSQSDCLYQEEWQLPTFLRGERIYWRQLVEDNSLLLWAGAMAVAVLVYLFSDRDLHEQTEKRKRSLRREYPVIVHKLVLYVGAGMTIRGAFQKIAGDYESKGQEGGRRSPACEEMLYTCRELHTGVSEGASYEHFGRRTGLQEYIRLSTLLTQNLKRGNSTLLERLREEADKAAEEQLQQSRKLGEEAGTKLLIPMVLMLAVVMVVIMIPAFSNM